MNEPDELMQDPFEEMNNVQKDYGYSQIDQLNQFDQIDVTKPWNLIVYNRDIYEPEVEIVKLFCKVFKVQLNVIESKSDSIFLEKLPVIYIPDLNFITKNFFLMFLSKVYYTCKYWKIQKDQKYFLRHLENQGIIYICEKLASSLEYFMWIDVSQIYKYRLKFHFTSPFKLSEQMKYLYFTKQKLKLQGIHNYKSAFIQAMQYLRELEIAKSQNQSFDLLNADQQQITLNDIVVYCHISSLVKNLPLHKLCEKFKSFTVLDQFYLKMTLQLQAANENQQPLELKYYITLNYPNQLQITGKGLLVPTIAQSLGVEQQMEQIQNLVQFNKNNTERKKLQQQHKQLTRQIIVVAGVILFSTIYFQSKQLSRILKKNQMNYSLQLFLTLLLSPSFIFIYL